MTPELREVIQSHANQGHTLRATAYLLDWPSAEDLQSLCERHGLAHYFQKTSPAPTVQHANGQHAELVEYQGITATYREHAERLGLAVSTVNRRRRRSDRLGYIFALAPQYSRGER